MSAETKFSFRAWSNILPTKPPEATIEGILLRGRFGVIFAQPDNGKTFAAIGAALSVGTGTLFGDRAVRKGHSIFVAAEAAYDVEIRVPAWRILHPDAGEPLGGCYGQVVNFYSQYEVGLFIEDVKKQLNGEHLELLVIDTLTASMVGGNQDWSKDMTIFINNVKMVMAETGCAVLIVHHAGWSETTREKGSIDLRGAADVVIETTLGEPDEADGSRVITLTCRKVKSMRRFQPFSMTLVPVTIDTPEGSFESLALGNPADTPAKKPSKQTDELESIEWCLEILGGRATHAQWYEQVRNFTAKRQGGRIVKEGWSEDKFDRLRKKLIEQGRVTGGGAQGEYYQLVGCRTGAAEGAAGSSTNHPQPQPLIGVAGSAGGFEGPASTRKPPANNSAGGSSESGSDQNPVVPDEPDFADEVLRHAHVGKKKPA